MQGFENILFSMTAAVLRAPAGERGAYNQNLIALRNVADGACSISLRGTLVSTVAVITQGRMSTLIRPTHSRLRCNSKPNRGCPSATAALAWKVPISVSSAAAALRPRLKSTAQRSEIVAIMITSSASSPLGRGDSEGNFILFGMRPRTLSNDALPRDASRLGIRRLSPARQTSFR